MNKYCILFLICLNIACQVNKERTLKQILPLPDSLKLEKVLISDFFIGKPNDMVVLNDYIVIQDQVENQWFALLDRQTGKLICRFGAIGRGPNELIRPYGLKGRDNNIIFTEQNKRKLYVYSMDSLSHGSDHFIINETDLQLKSQNYSTCRYLWPLSSGEILASAVHPSGRIVLLDSLGHEKRCFSPDYPDDPQHQEEDYQIKSKAFQYDIAVDESETMLCHVGISTEHFEIFKWDSDTLKKVVEHIFSLPKYTNLGNGQMLQIAFDKDSKSGFRHLRCVNNQIWFATEDEEMRGGGIDQIVCFNWEGRALACYEPNMILKLFSIAPDGRTLYAIAMSSETMEPMLVRGELGKGNC